MTATLLTALVYLYVVGVLADGNRATQDAVKFAAVHDIPLPVMIRAGWLMALAWPITALIHAVTVFARGRE